MYKTYFQAILSTQANIDSKHIFFNFQIHLPKNQRINCVLNRSLEKLL